MLIPNRLLLLMSLFRESNECVYSSIGRACCFLSLSQHSLFLSARSLSFFFRRALFLSRRCLFPFFIYLSLFISIFFFRVSLSCVLILFDLCRRVVSHLPPRDGLPQQQQQQPGQQILSAWEIELVLRLREFWIEQMEKTARSPFQTRPRKTRGEKV